MRTWSCSAGLPVRTSSSNQSDIACAVFVGFALLSQATVFSRLARFAAASCRLGFVRSTIQGAKKAVSWALRSETPQRRARAVLGLQPGQFALNPNELSPV